MQCARELAVADKLADTFVLEYHWQQGCLLALCLLEAVVHEANVNVPSRVELPLQLAVVW